MSSLHFLICVTVLTISPVLASSETQIQCANKILHHKELNFTSSRDGGASIDTVSAATVKSAQECATSCCQEPEGRCNIGLYDSQIVQQNCLLISCQPSSACLFQPAVDVDLVLVTKDKKLTTLPPTIGTESKTQKISLDNSNSNTSFNSSSLVLSGSSTEPSPSLVKTVIPVATENSSSQLTNIGIVDVDSKLNSNITKETDATDEKSFSNSKQSSNLNSSSAPIKQKTTTILEPVATTATFFPDDFPKGFQKSNENTLDVDKSKGSKPRKGVFFKQANASVELSNILKDEINDTELELAIDPSSNTSSSDKQITYLKNNSNEQIAEKIATTPNAVADASTSPIYLSTVKAYVKNFSSVSTEVPKLTTSNSGYSKPSTTIESVNYSVVTQVPFSFIPSSNASDSSNPSEILTTVNSTSSIIEPKISISSASSDISLSSKHVAFTDVPTGRRVSTSIVSAIKATTATESDKDDWHVKAKFHLVIALVLGLMLLLTVVGLTLRRIYDVWQRRHYQRMDFLIDGLYNSINT